LLLNDALRNDKREKSYGWSGLSSRIEFLLNPSDMLDMTASSKIIFLSVIVEVFNKR